LITVTDNSLNKLQRVQNAAARLITGAKITKIKVVLNEADEGGEGDALSAMYQDSGLR